MSFTLPWIVFEKGYLRPQLLGTLDDNLSTQQLQALTYTVIGDIRARGLTDVGPAPTETAGELTSITAITGIHESIANVLAAGVRYFLVSDPINNLKTTLSLDITKDKDLVESLRLRYFELADVYFKVHHCDIELCAAWNSVGESGSGDNKCCLTLEEQILLDNAKTKNKIKLLDTTRAYKLDDRDYYLNRKADNAVKTLSGPFAITYLTEYEEELVAPVTDETKFTEADLNLPDSTINQAQVFTSKLIDTTNFDVLEITIVADQPLTVTYLQLTENASQFQQIEEPISSDLIFRKYYMRDTNFIRLVIEGLTDNTKFYIKGNLR